MPTPKKDETNPKPHEIRLSKADRQLIFDLRRLVSGEKDKENDALRALRLRVLRANTSRGPKGKLVYDFEDSIIREEGRQRLVERLEGLLRFRRLSTRDEARERGFKVSYLTRTRLLRFNRVMDFQHTPDSFVDALCDMEGVRALARIVNIKQVVGTQVRWRIAPHPRGHIE